MANMDNPAGRLRHWINTLVASPTDDALVIEVARLLDVDHGTPQGINAILRFSADLSELCQEVRHEAALLPPEIHPHILMKDFGQIELAVGMFTQPHQVRLSSLKQRIDPAGHLCLELMDANLHTQRPQQALNEEALHALIEQVRGLIDDITETSELDGETKHFVLARLAEIEKALRNAQLRGSDAVEIATDALIGGMRRRPELWHGIKDTEWGKRLGGIALVLCTALGLAADVRALMPGDDAPQEITVVNNTNITDNDVTHNIVIEGDADNVEVVDAELVGDAE